MAVELKNESSAFGEHLDQRLMFLLYLAMLTQSLFPPGERRSEIYARAYSGCRLAELPDLPLS